MDHLLSRLLAILGITGSFQGYTDSPLYLYNRGTWSNLQAPKFSESAGSGWGGYAENSEYIIFSGVHANHTYHACRSNQKINLTPYKYIKFLSSGGNNLNVYMGVSTNDSFSDPGQLAAYSMLPNIRNTLIVVDISGLNGEYYFCVFLRGASNTSGTSTIKVEEIYLANL